MSPGYKTLDGWRHEMMERQSVDPDHQHTYYNGCEEIDAEQVSRLEDFLQRHGLYDKFLAEDKSGKR
jgi:hypothetical protein